jgi:hypothetical protein
MPRRNSVATTRGESCPQYAIKCAVMTAYDVGRKITTARRATETAKFATTVANPF